MGKADSTKDRLARILMYGPQKTKKTWWSCALAAHGFNVILLDSDDGAHIVNAQTIPSLAARQHIDVVRIVDRFAKPVAADFLARLIKGKPFWYDNTDQTFPISASLVDTEHDLYHVDVSKLGPSDVLILDSHSANQLSVMQRAANDFGVDLEELKKDEQRDLFGYANRFLSTMLSRLHALPCHLIVVGHAITYEKYDNKDPKKPKLISSRIQPLSSSGPHGETLGKHFSDVFVTSLMGTNIQIDTQPSMQKDCGSRVVPPALYKWEDLPAIKVFQMHRFDIPGDGNWRPQEAFKNYAPGEFEKPQSASTVPVQKTPEVPVLQQPVVGGTSRGINLSSMLKKG